MASSQVFNLVNSTLHWVAATLDAPSSGAVVFGVPIGGHLSSGHDMPPKKPLTDKVSLNFYASKPHSIHWTAFYIHNLREFWPNSPFDEIVKLKEKYRFLVLLDESNSFGVLGTAGRGLTEFYGVPVENIHDIITAAMGHALAAGGGFGTGSARVNDHQRLSSSGYVFSASLSPYLVSAAITAIDVLEENPGLIMKLKKTLLYYE